MSEEDFYSRALSFDEVGMQVDIFEKEKAKYQQQIDNLNNVIRELEDKIYYLYNYAGLDTNNLKKELTELKEKYNAK